MRRIFLLLLAAVPFVCAPAAAQPTGRVVGIVFDSATGAPVAQARVSSARRAGVTTDADGRFVLRASPGFGSALVQRIGYDQALVNWELQGDSVMLYISLRPARIVLDEIRVELDRLDRLIRSAPYSVLTMDNESLARSTATDLLGAINDRYRFAVSGCTAFASAARTGCVRVRGLPARACVLVDEGWLPSGIEGLRAYRAGDMGRVFVIGGGRVIVGYTRWFLEAQSRRKRWSALPVGTLTAMCR